MYLWGEKAKTVPNRKLTHDRLLAFRASRRINYNS